MKRTFIYVLAVILCFCALACKKTPPKLDSKQCTKAKGYYQLGVSYMNADDSTSALEEFLKAEEMCPADPDLQNAMGLIYYSKEKFDKAITHLKKAIELDPENSDAKHNLGVLYLYLNQYDSAITLFQEALENDLYRNQANTLNALGWAYFKKKNYLKAEAFFNQTLDRDRLYLPAYVNLGKVYIALERYQDSTAILEKALQLNPYYAEAHLDMGISYMKLGNNEKAVFHFKKALEYEPLGKIGSQAQEFLNLLE